MKKFYKILLNIGKRYLTGYFNILLTFLVLLFVLRPYERADLYNAFWQMVFIIVLLSSVFNCHHPKFVKVLALCIGIPALFAHWLDLIYQKNFLVIICLSLSIAFIIISTISILFRVVVRAKVTLETLRGAICAYFLIGFGFSMAYFLVALIEPNSFHISYVEPGELTFTRYLSEMIYYSFVTMLTIGYGDITATRDVAQTLSILEAMIGQFYIAILVARLVAVYSIIENKSILERITREEQKEKKT